MQYKGFKNMKRVAAVILSAAIVLTDVPGAFAAETVQTPETSVAEETAKDAATKDAATENAADETVTEENSISESESPDRVESGSETTGQPQEEGSQTSTGEEQTQGALGSETEPEETQTASATETESAQIKTQEEQSTEQPSEEGVSETAEISTEEASEQESEHRESVSIPEVDASVYEAGKIDYTYIGNTAPIAGYNAKGVLEKNEQGEYTIENRDQFITFLASGTDYSGSVVRLNCDVDMKGETAQFAKTFDGTFEGNGHSIYHFKAEGALFRQVGANGEIKNLHLGEVSFSQETATAALVYTNQGKISNITVNADIKVTAKMSAAAGIVIENIGTISDCAYAGTITAAAGTDNAGKAIGGIVSSNKGTVENCHALGAVNTNAALIGGIAASNYKTIRNCTNHMSITGAYCIGGIVAENIRTVTGCANYGTVTQKNSTEEGLAGGIAAKNTDTVSSCENYAEISGVYKNIGGIAGSSSGAVTGCGNYAAVAGSENVGGIVGLFDAAGSDDSNQIHDSFNKGKVSAKQNSGSKNQGIGGILGAASQNASLSIKNCYNTEGIQGASETKYLGGIAGILYKGSIQNTYTTGSVPALEAAGVFAGYLGAEADAVCTDSLFLEGNSDTLYYRKGTAVTASTEKKTADELKSQEALLTLGEGFSADESGMNGGYPVIKGQNAENNRCVIMYEPGGGCADYYFTMVTKGGFISEPSTPFKKSASFKGWFRDPAKSRPYSFSDSVTESAVIYAGWENYETVEEITLEQTEVTLVKNESFNLKEKVGIKPAGAQNAALVFASSDTSVAEIDEEGIIKAVSAGTAKISIKIADGSLDKELTFKVTVTDKENIVRFKVYDDKETSEITKTAISISEPVTVQAVFGVTPPPKATVQWTSSRPDYVKVTERTDLAGINAARLEGLKPTTTLSQNKVDIICTLIYADKTTTFTGTLSVMVRPFAESISVQAGREDITGKKVVFDLGTKKFIAVEDTKLLQPVDSLSAIVLPKDASPKVKWSSSDTSVIKFDDEYSGAAEGNRKGTATVTATVTDGSKGKDGKPVTGQTTVVTRRIIQELSFTPKSTDKDGKVSVDQYGRIEITEGTSVRLEPVYVPADASEKTLKWTNGNKNALSIKTDSANVLTVTAGKVARNTVVKLKVEAMDMGGVSSEVEFIIKPKVEKIKIFRTDDPDNCVSGGNIGIDPEKDNMSFRLMAVNEPSDASQAVTWKIDSTKVATLKDNDDGTCTVTVKGKGTAAITATAVDGSKMTAVTTLNVTSLATSVEIEGSNMVMKGKTIKLTASVYPKAVGDKGVKWESLMPEYAKVNEKTGEVQGVKAGFAIISAKVNDGSGASGSHAVWVMDPIESFDLMIPDGDDNEKNDELLTGKTVGLDPDNDITTYTVAARILPNTACQNVTWKSSNEKVATVKDGVITAKGLGTAVIMAQATDGSGKSASVNINITTLTRSVEITGGHYVGIGKSLQLSAKVGDKDAVNKNVVWTSSVPQVATVDKKGCVKAAGSDGMTVITAEAADGSGAKAEHKVYVVGQKNNVKISTYDDDYTIETESGKKQIKDIDLADVETIEIRLKAELKDGSAIRDNIPMDISWETSNKTVATVEADEEDSGIGTVTVYQAGTVVITAKSTEGYGTSESVTLQIKNTNPFVRIKGASHQLAQGKKMQLTAGGATVDWSSGNERLAKVNDKGQVTAGKNVTGIVTITAKAVDGNHYDTYSINIEKPVKKVDITINGETATNKKVGVDLMKGYKGAQEVQLGALLDGTPGDAEWKTSNSNVAEIDEEGFVDVKQNGSVTFTATAMDGSKKKGKVTLVISKQTTGITPADGADVVEIGLKKSTILSVTYRPLSVQNKKATWVSSNPSVVNVHKSSGKITGKRVSTDPVTVTATAADGSGVSCQFTVYVRPAVNMVEIVKASTEPDVPDSAYQNVIGVDLSTSADTVALKANLYTKSGKKNVLIDSHRVSWSSSNKEIAEVDENGVVKALKNGEVTITATALDGSKKSGKVKLYIGKLIKSISLSDEFKDGIKLNLRTKKSVEIAGELFITPITATNQDLEYTTSNKKIVTVNAKGKVVAKKVGTAEITVTPKDGSGVILKIPVTVTK